MVFAFIATLPLSFFLSFHHRRAHISHLLTPGHHCHVERHVSASSEYLKCLVFGGLDGIVTIFAIVAGCVGAHLSPVQTLIVGIGNLLADAISMGFGEVSLSAIKSEQDTIIALHRLN